MQTKSEVCNIIKSAILAEGRYLTLKEIQRITGLSFFSMYKAFPEGVSQLNLEVGFSKRKVEDDLPNRILSFIRDKGTYCSANVVSKGIKVSRCCIRKAGISIPDLNAQLGFFSDANSGRVPVSAGHNKLSTAIIDGYHSSIVNYIRVKGESCDFTHLGKALSLPSWLGSKINLADMHAEAGVEFLGLKRKSSTMSMVEEVTRIIDTAGRYIPSTTLASIMGIPASTLSYRGIDTQAINNSLGFTKDNGYFEYSVYVILADIFKGFTIHKQKTFAKCRSPLGNLMFFDFYVEEAGLLVEADGPGHFDKGHPWYTEEGMRRDAIKDAFVKDSGMLLCRVPYVLNVTKEYMLKQLSGIPLEVNKLQHS